MCLVDRWVSLVLLAALYVMEPAASAETLRQVDVEDPSGHALDRFAAALRATSAEGSRRLTRIAHYGDSLVVVDELTATLRRLYQRRYGDGGPGFVVAAPPWPWYRRVGLSLSASEGWTIFRSISGGPEDHRYGYGGVTFETRRVRRELRYRTTTVDGAPVEVSRLDVHYLEQPGGGAFEVRIDGVSREVVRTVAEAPRSAFRTLTLEPGPHEVLLRTVAPLGRVRLFGVALERDGPGVVYDSLGLNGTCMTVLGRMDEANLAEQMAHRRPDLVVLTFGACETKRPGLVKRYGGLVGPILKMVRRVAPEASCVVMGPMDRGLRGAARPIKSNPLVPRVAALQRRAAFDAGCAFWSAYEAMGGAGSVARWRREGLVKGDMTHPTRRGADVLGQGLFEALERAVSRSGAQAP